MIEQVVPSLIYLNWVQNVFRIIQKKEFIVYRKYSEWDIMDKQSDIYSSVELTSVQSVLCKLAVL